MPQQITDLSEAVPETFPVRLEHEGPVYQLPGDIPIPDFIELERLVNDLEDPEAEGTGGEKLQALYEKVLEIFQVHQPDLESLPIGPKRLGALIVHLYSGAADADGGDDARPPKAAGTPSTKPKRSKRSASSKS
jgi:hypothetical protein